MYLLHISLTLGVRVGCIRFRKLIHLSLSRLSGVNYSQLYLFLFFSLTFITLISLHRFFIYSYFAKSNYYSHRTKGSSWGGKREGVSHKTLAVRGDKDLSNWCWRSPSTATTVLSPRLGYSPSKKSSRDLEGPMRCMVRKNSKNNVVRIT